MNETKLHNIIMYLTFFSLGIVITALMITQGFFQEFIYDPAFWKKRHFIFFDYACKADSLKVELNDEAEDHVWVRLEDALRLPLDSYTLTSVEKIIEGNLS